MESNASLKAKAIARLYDILALQKEVISLFGEEDYNVFIFGSYITTKFEEGKSDIDIAIYTCDFDLYKRMSLYIEEYFLNKNIESDIFYIDTTMVAPIYCAPLNSEVQFTNYFPQELKDFQLACQRQLDDTKMVVLK